MILQKGTRAPEFQLYKTPDHTFSLRELKGKPAILVFYPADWSPVCGDQLAVYNEALRFFQKHGAQLVGISVDSKWCHQAFAENRNLHFPLLADFEPKGRVSQLYGAYNEEQGQSSRAIFVLDEEGIISWSYLSPDEINPGADGILEALEELSTVKS
ncbi:MAG: redoxin domain-containing protein [Flavisolibacter sp.]